MKSLIIASVALLCGVLANTATAQPSAADINRPNNYPTRTAADPIKETIKLATVMAGAEASLEGRIVSVNAAEKNLVVEELKRGRRFRVALTQDTRFKADKDSEWAGKKLSFIDFKIGQLVRVTYTLGPTVLEVRLRKDRNVQAPARPMTEKPSDPSRPH